jgi:hypothetical protein
MAASAQAQTAEDALRFSQRDPATGARLLGMGGAGAAGLGDWSDLFTNPAGLGWIRNSSVTGALNTLSTTDDGVFLGQFQDGTATRTRLGNLGYIHKVPTGRGSMVFGVAFNQVGTFERELFFQGQNGLNSITDFFMPLPEEFDIEIDSEDNVDVTFSRPISFIAYETYAIDFDRDLFDQGSDVPFLPAVTAGTVEQIGEVFETGSTNELSFGGAVEAAPGVMFGLGANLTFGTYEFERLFDEFDINGTNDGTNGTTDFESLLLVENLETDLAGINLRGGVSARVLPQIRIGLTIETPTYYAIDEVYNSRLETTFDNGDTYADETGGGSDYRITTPWRFSGGLTFQQAGITLAVDAELIDWSQLRMDSDSGDEFFFDSINRNIRRTFDSVINTRFGAEYDFGPLAVRGGYAIQPDPTETPELDRKREFVSAGIGFNAGRQLQVNLGWMRGEFNDRYQPYSEVTDAPVVDEQITSNRFSVGIQVGF